MVVFPLGNRHWYRLAESGGTLENLSLGLDKISLGSDEHVKPSPDGAFLVVQSSRFGCASGGCLSRFYWDLSAGEPILAGGRAVSTNEGRAVIASGGDRIVYPARGPHSIDLWVINRQANNSWSAPLLLTGNSTYPQHHDAAISRDGSKVAFDCGPSPYQAPGTSICEVNTDGTGFHKIVDPSDGPGGSQSNTTHHPDYAPDGSIVFEADWLSEQVWRIAPGGSPVKVSPANQTNDNSPCVLESGRVASLWLPNATHDIKVMAASGATSVMILSGNDVLDVGMGCGH